MNAFESAQNNAWLNYAAHCVMDVHMDHFVARTCSAVCDCYGNVSRLICRHRLPVDRRLAKSEGRMAQPKTKRKQWRVVVEDVPAPGSRCLVVIDRKLPNIACDCDRQMT